FCAPGGRLGSWLGTEPTIRLLLLTEMVLLRVPSVLFSRMVTPAALGQPLGTPGALSRPSARELPLICTLPATVSAPGRPRPVPTVPGAAAPPRLPLVVTCNCTLRRAAMSD